MTPVSGLCFRSIYQDCKYTSLIYTEFGVCCNTAIEKTLQDSKSIIFHRDFGLNINLGDWWRVHDLCLFQVDG